MLGGREPILRLLFDGSNNVKVNTEIRVRDKQETPATGDIKTMMRTQAEVKSPHFGLTFDIDGAHENVPVAESDWPYQAVRGTDPSLIFISMFALFGVSSIAYWWARLAGALIRAIHYILGIDRQLWALVFADDYLLTATGQKFAENLLMALVTARLFGFPLNWHKCTGGFRFAWIGLELWL